MLLPQQTGLPQLPPEDEAEGRVDLAPPLDHPPHQLVVRVDVAEPNQSANYSPHPVSSSQPTTRGTRALARDLPLAGPEAVFPRPKVSWPMDLCAMGLHTPLLGLVTH